MTETTQTRWRCPGCGSADVQKLAWAYMNSGTIDVWEEGDYYCPDCLGHYGELCRVNSEGFCLMHEQPQSECLPKRQRAAEQLSHTDPVESELDDAQGGAS